MYRVVNCHSAVVIRRSFLSLIPIPNFIKTDADNFPLMLHSCNSLSCGSSSAFRFRLRKFPSTRILWSHDHTILRSYELGGGVGPGAVGPGAYGAGALGAGAPAVANGYSGMILYSTTSRSFRICLCFEKKNNHFYLWIIGVTGRSRQPSGRCGHRNGRELFTCSTTCAKERKDLQKRIHQSN